MANVFQYVDWMKEECLDLLTNDLPILSSMNRDVEEDFNKSFAVGDTVRVKKPQKFTVRDGLGYNPQGLNRIVVTVSLDQPFGLDFEWDSFEKAVKMERSTEQLSKEYLKPAMEQLAQEAESRAALFAKNNANNVVGILGTDPTTFDAVSGAARQRMVELACPLKDRMMFVPPNVMRGLKATQLTFFNPIKDVSKAYQTGMVGNADSFDWDESVSLYNHTAGSLTATPTVKTSSVNGDTSLAITCTNGDTLLQGDVIAVASCNQVNPMTRRKVTTTTKQFVVTTPGTTTAAASTITVNVSPTIYGPGSQYQNVDALPVAGATVTLFPGTSNPNGKSGINGIAFQTNAFTAVSVKLEIPDACEVGWAKRDPETGTWLMFIRMFDPVQRKMINRFDMLLGFGALYPDECAVRVLGA